MVEGLTKQYRDNGGVARYDVNWKSFQYDFTLEEVIYGHSMSRLDFQISVSLGTNSVSDKSLTKQRGFIGLAPHSRASSEETPPPLHHWTKQTLKKLQIEHVFPLCQALEAEAPVTGATVVNVLLGDIYKRNTDIPMAAMKSTTSPGKLVSAWQLDTLCANLAVKESFAAPNTFARAGVLVERSGHDIKECLMLGFLESKLKFFPAFKFRDFKGTKRTVRTMSRFTTAA